LAFPAHPQLTKPLLIYDVTELIIAIGSPNIGIPGASSIDQTIPTYDVTELIIAIGSPNIGIPGASSINRTTAYLWRKSILINTALFSLYAIVTNL